MEIGLLVSGDLGKAVMEQLLRNHKIKFILTDKQSSDIIDLALKNSVACYAGNPRNGKAKEAIPNLSCEVLVSVNYLFLIEKDLIDIPSYMAINFHGSLLPKYRGRTPHVWAIINDEKKTGITAHIIEESCDTGDIISQKEFIIDENDTGASILEKFKIAYPNFVNDVLEQLNNRTVKPKKQNHTMATFFGKRTSESGEINWQWQKQRIRNWVRAQAKPYPGAFTFAGEGKVVIHKIVYSEQGFNNEDPNGKILGFEKNKPIVKTPNGCIILEDYQCSNELTLGTVFK